MKLIERTKHWFLARSRVQQILLSVAGVIPLVIIWAIWFRGPFLKVSVSDIRSQINARFPDIEMKSDWAMKGWIISFPVGHSNLWCFRMHGVSGDRCRQIEATGMQSIESDDTGPLIEAVLESARMANRDWTRNIAADWVQRVLREHEVIDRDHAEGVLRVGRYRYSEILKSFHWELTFTAI